MTRVSSFCLHRVLKFMLPQYGASNVDTNTSMIGLDYGGVSQDFFLAVRVSFKQTSTCKYSTRQRLFAAKPSLLSTHMVCLLGYSLLQEALTAMVQDMFICTVRYFTKASFTPKVHFAVNRSDNNSEKKKHTH